MILYFLNYLILLLSYQDSHTWFKMAALMSVMVRRINSVISFTLFCVKVMKWRLQNSVTLPFFFHIESAYKMETFELSCTRLPHDRTAGRVKYFLQKDNRVMFIIAKNREDNKFSCSHHVSPKPCSNDSFSMNETYVSFKLRNITLQDAGRYVCLKYSPGLYNLTSEEIDLNVLGKVFKHILMIYWHWSQASLN